MSTGGHDPRIGTQLGPFRIDAVLGRGGMGLVYLATNLSLDRREAVKVLSPDLASDPDFRERFVRESRLAANFRHPNAVPVYAAGDAEGCLYIAMQLVEGTDLRTLIDREGALAVPRALKILEQLGRALDAAHGIGLVHRDVKPANILIEPAPAGEHVYLTDFGLTRRMESKTALTRPGQFVGTLNYVAPEQIEGKSVDGRTDQYSLACVAYECLSGNLPFERQSDVAKIYAHLFDPPPVLSSTRPELGPGVDDVLRRAMAKAPGDRFETCGAFVQAVEGALVGGDAVGPVEVPERAVPATQVQPPRVPPSPQPRPAHVPPPPPVRPPTPTPEPSSRVPIIIAVVTGSLLAVAVALAAFNAGVGGGPTPDPTFVSGTTEPTAPATPVPTEDPLGPVLFRDDFSDTASGWPTLDDGTKVIEYVDGTLRIHVPQADYSGWPYANFPESLRNIANQSVEVTARLAGGPADSRAMVTCRNGEDPSGLFYLAFLGGDGLWGLSKRAHEQWSTFTGGETAALGHRTRMRLDCVGANPVVLRMYMDGALLGEARDDKETIQTGAPGLATYGGKAGGGDIRWDDFIVREPRA